MSDNFRKQWEELFSIPGKNKPKGKDYHKSRRIPVQQIDLHTGEILAEYPSIYAAINETGITSIRACVKGRIDQAGGYFWKESPNAVRPDDTIDVESEEIND